MEDSIFGKKYDTMSGHLADIKTLREAFIFESISSKGTDTVEKFIKSPEAKVMIEQELISDDLLARLKDNEFKDKNFEITILHMAKEDNDPKFAQLIALRNEERTLMNDLINQYSDTAITESAYYTQKFLKNEMPREFQ